MSVTVPELLDLEEVAERTHLSRVALYEIVLPNVRSVKLGRRRLVYAADLLAFLESNTLGQAPTDPASPPVGRRRGRPKKTVSA